MKNVMLTVSYDGTDFFGWQRQDGKRTVQQTLEEAISAVTKENISVIGSGRTDSGVHALGQACNFKTDSTVPPEKFYKALNPILPPDVKVLASKLVDDDFNSRRNAKRKTYVYTLYHSETSLPLYDRFAVQVFGLNVEKMRACAKYIVGEHDFKCFQATGSTVKSTVRTIYDLEIEENGLFITVKVTGNGFLYNMVRMIVGALVKVGMGKSDEEAVRSAIDGGKRVNIGKTMPAKGLCLYGVIYK